MMGANPSHTGSGIGPSNPVSQVSWYDALVFCNKLSVLEGLTPVYITYYWDLASDSATVGQYAWYDQNSNSRTQPVARPTRQGLFQARTASPVAAAGSIPPATSGRPIATTTQTTGTIIWVSGLSCPPARAIVGSDRSRAGSAARVCLQQNEGRVRTTCQ